MPRILSRDHLSNKSFTRNYSSQSWWKNSTGYLTAFQDSTDRPSLDKLTSESRHRRNQSEESAAPTATLTDREGSSGVGSELSSLSDHEYANPLKQDYEEINEWGHFVDCENREGGVRKIGRFLVSPDRVEVRKAAVALSNRRV